MHSLKMGFPDYIQTLEEERRKIQVFSKELPLSLELVTQGNATKKPAIHFCCFGLRIIKFPPFFSGFVFVSGVCCWFFLFFCQPLKLASSNCLELRVSIIWMATRSVRSRQRQRKGLFWRSLFQSRKGHHHHPLVVMKMMSNILTSKGFQRKIITVIRGNQTGLDLFSCGIQIPQLRR